MFGAKKIKNSEKYQWTRHAQYKMQQYGLSPQRITRVIRNPERTEEGIVPKTIAVMQPASIKFKDGRKTWSQEIWAMYQIKRIKNNELRIKDNIKNKKLEIIHDSLFMLRNSANRKIRIISAWRYPGVSPKNNPIPEEILREIADLP